MWQLGRKLLACQKCPGADPWTSSKLVTGASASCLLFLLFFWITGVGRWETCSVLPILNYPEDAVQPRPSSAYCHSTLQGKGKVPDEIKLGFPLFHFAIVPCSYISVGVSSEKRAD